MIGLGKHGHHGGGHWNGRWGGYLPWNRFNTSSPYAPIAFTQQTVAVPNWALFTGLGLLAVLAFGGRR